MFENIGSWSSLERPFKNVEVPYKAVYVLLSIGERRAVPLVIGLAYLGVSLAEIRPQLVQNLQHDTGRDPLGNRFEERSEGITLHGKGCAVFHV